MLKAEAAALLGWWREAGVDALVAPSPASWRTPPAEQPAVPKPAVAAGTAPASPAPAAPDATFARMATLAELQSWVATNAPQAILGDGNPAAGLMLMGEGPSRRDLATGVPFSGPSGQFLDRMLAAIGLDRHKACLGILAPRRRIPGPVPEDDIQADLALTLAHIRLVRPKVLLLMGGAATRTLTGRKEPISKLRGTWLAPVAPELAAIPALATFNPAYLLRRPIDKRLAWDDLLALRDRLREEGIA